MLTSPATYQPFKEDYLTGRLPDIVQAAMEKEHNHKYYLSAYPKFYFIIRDSVDPAESDRVCLYRENVVNPYLFTGEAPGTVWVSNEPCLGRALHELIADMTEKAAHCVTVKPPRK